MALARDLKVDEVDVGEHADVDAVFAAGTSGTAARRRHGNGRRVRPNGCRVD